MKENLAGRVGRIISGSVNALVDAVENSMPETVMEEVIREIEGAVDEVRAELGWVAAKKHMANTRLINENLKHEDLSEKIELAVKEARDDLAETAIASQLDIEAQIPVLTNTIADCSEKEKELESYIAALQAKKRELASELQQFRASQKQAQAISAGDANTGQSGVESRVSRAESAFDRALESGSGLPGLAGMEDKKSEIQLAELEEMARKNRIQERLAAIKESQH